MNIVFMGSPDFARISLEAVYNAGYNILAVVTNPDKPKGRGKKMLPTEVKEFAMEKNLKIYEPTRVRNNEEFLNEMQKLNPDVICVVAYGKILPQELLDIPKYGAVNVHGSLLPEYRGAAPIQWAVLDGKTETGITTMFMDAGMDTGDMILKESLSIGENETTGEVWNREAELGAKMLVETLKKIDEASQTIDISDDFDEDIKEIIKTKVGATKQPEEGTLAPMLNKEMAKIDWSKSASKVHNLIRGLNPIMGAWTMIDGKKVKIWKSEIYKLEAEEEVLPGTFIINNPKKGLVIKAGDDAINVLEVQAENSKKMDIKSFLNGVEIHSIKVDG